MGQQFGMCLISTDGVIPDKFIHFRLQRVEQIYLIMCFMHFEDNTK